ncbi:HAD hydrolase, family IA, variant 1 [Bacteroidales bacterium KA00344]|nr:HAD hydrolase, family IA, variant 1 [Bacteroidales bacterium KA00344]
MIKGYIFDYGGTLDTAGCHWGQMLWGAYQRNHIPVSEQQFRDAYVYAERTLGVEPIIRPDFTFYKTLVVKIRLEMEHLCASGAWGADEQEFKAGHNAVLADVYARVKEITAYSSRVLSKLGEHYPMVLVSNFYGNINTVLQEFELDKYFRDVIESAAVGIRKPDARIFNLGVKSLGLRPEETMVVGDSFYKDIEPAVKIGCHSTWFKGKGWTDKTYDETLPDFVITDLAQLLET